MIFLVAGILLWSFIHLLPACAQSWRSALVQRLGIAGYKLGFTGLIILSIGLMVLGWRSITPEQVFIVTWLPLHFAYAGIFLGLWLMLAASFKTRIKRALRHPQLTGFLVWALMHLLVNGDQRSIVLFGGLAVWACIEMLVLNRRDGSWSKPAATAWAKEFFVLVATVFAFALIFYAHPYYTGRTLAL